MDVAFIGTRGVPARYGGFETAVEEIGRRLAAMGHEVRVYSRGRGVPRRYLGMRTVVLPTLRTKYTDTFVHSLFAILHALVHRPDVAVVFNAANAPAATLFRLARVPFLVHVDGLEWRRAKWGMVGSRYYRFSEWVAARVSDAVVADSQAIAKYHRDRYHIQPVFIPYGAPDPDSRDVSGLELLGLPPNSYHLVVARFEPENNLLPIIRGFVASRATRRLVVVGGGAYGSFERRVREAAKSDHRVTFLGPVWDQDLLNALYCGACSYIHGHSVGGTNPSLLRAAGCGTLCIAFDVEFNREVLGEDAHYFGTPDSLARHLESVEANLDEAADRGRRAQASVLARYDWDDVAHRYARLCEVVSQSRAYGRRSGD